MCELCASLALPSGMSCYMLRTQALFLVRWAADTRPVQSWRLWFDFSLFQCIGSTLVLLGAPVCRSPRRSCPAPSTAQPLVLQPATCTPSRVVSSFISESLANLAVRSKAVSDQKDQSPGSLAKQEFKEELSSLLGLGARVADHPRGGGRKGAPQQRTSQRAPSPPPSPLLAGGCNVSRAALGSIGTARDRST